MLSLSSKFELEQGAAGVKPITEQIDEQSYEH